jgi:hypothetical protein
MEPISFYICMKLDFFIIEYLNKMKVIAFCIFVFMIFSIGQALVRKHSDVHDGTFTSIAGASTGLAGTSLGIMQEFSANPQAQDTLLKSCYVKSYGRGVGTIPNDCNGGKEKDGALCYKQCKSGYNGVGPVCWQNCPSRFTDIGAFCQKPKPYGRGGGYVLWNKNDCKNDHKDVGC